MLTHLYEIVRQRASEQPETIAFGAQDGLRWQTITSRQLLVAVDRLAAELSEHGVVEGDRVVLWLPSHWRTPVYLFALWKLGAVAVPFDREMNPEAAGSIVAKVEPRLVIVGFAERPAWLEGQRVVPWRETGLLPDRLDRQAADQPWRRPHEELAAIFFTSGTTGAPKGCMITHANLCSQVEALTENIPLDSTCRLASILPLSHLFELTCGLLYPLARGAAVHYVPSRRGPDVVRVLSEQRITHMIAVPQLLTMMGKALDDQLDAKLPRPVNRALKRIAPRLPLRARRWLYWPAHRKIGGHLLMMASGGAALPAETQLLWERLGVRVVQGYGASECSPVIACGAADGSTPLGSVGKPLRGAAVRLSAEGELLVRGPNVMRGYFQDAVKTADVLRDGWYSTGDLASIDAGGNVRLAGRAKDLIVLPSGMNVWPQDVEDVLRAQPGIKDAAVLAVAAPSGGATLHAYLLPESAAPRSGEIASLIARANGRLAQHQRLATASWWPESDFPRTSTLKVRRNLLPAPETTAVVQVDSALAADDPVGQAIAAAANASAVGDDQTLGQLGLDSLAFVSLALALEEKTGKTVGDSDLRPDMTVQRVRDFVATAAAVGAGEDGQPKASASAELRLEANVHDQPLWPYTWGRALRWLGFPFDALYRWAVTRTIVLGRENVIDLPARVIFAGTHHSFADLPLVRAALAKTGGRRLARRLVVAAYAGGFASAGLFARYSALAFGIFPLRQYGERDVSLRNLAKLADAGLPAKRAIAVLIFPQGQHVEPEQEEEGHPQAQFKTGVAHLAAGLDAVVVPFGLAGTERLMPPFIDQYKGLVIAGVPVSITRGPLAIAFGKPLHLQPDETPQEFAARLQAASFALARQAEHALGK